MGSSGFFTLSAFNSLRTILWWSLVTAPLFACGIHELLLPKLTDSKEQGKNNVVFNWCIAFLFVVYLISFLPWFKNVNPLIPANKKSLFTLDTPVNISEKVKTLTNVRNIFNDYSWGSYFIWSLREDQKVFYDPRAAIYPPKTISDYFQVSDGENVWQEILDKYKVDALVLNKEEQGKLIPQVKFSKKWKQVYEDKLGYVFVKDPT